jgi:hypothetical protein
LIESEQAADFIEDVASSVLLGNENENSVVVGVHACGSPGDFNVVVTIIFFVDLNDDDTVGVFEELKAGIGLQHRESCFWILALPSINRHDLRAAASCCKLIDRAVSKHLSFSVGANITECICYSATVQSTAVCQG